MNYEKLRLSLRPQDPLQSHKKDLLKIKRNLLDEHVNNNSLPIKYKSNLSKYIQQAVYNKGAYLSLKKNQFYERVKSVDIPTEVKVKSKFASKFGITEYNTVIQNIYGVPASGYLDSLKLYQKYCSQFINSNNSVTDNNDQLTENTSLTEFINSLQFYEPLYKRDRDNLKHSLSKICTSKKEPEKKYIYLVYSETEPLQKAVNILNTYPLKLADNLKYIEDKKEHESIIKELISYIVSSKNYENFRGKP